jgi:hypothetical protein
VEAFLHCDALEMVNFPVVVSLGGNAFGYCTGLATIILPASLTNIEGNPFPLCTGLTVTVAAANPKYMLEDGKLLTKDGKTLVGWSNASGDVTLPGITTVSDYAFWNCTGLTSVSLPAATSIGGNAFFRCDALETVSLPAAAIGTYAFGECHNLTSVDLPAATSISGYAFIFCTGLTSVSLPAATSIGANAFYGTGTGPLAVTLGPAVPELGWVMFGNVTGGPKLVTVKVPDNPVWNAIIGAYDGTSTANDTWGNAFRGGGWDGESYLDGTVNSNIRLTIEVQEETP